MKVKKATLKKEGYSTKTAINSKEEVSSIYTEGQFMVKNSLPKRVLGKRLKSILDSIEVDYSVFYDSEIRIVELPDTYDIPINLKKGVCTVYLGIFLHQKQTKISFRNRERTTGYKMLLEIEEELIKKVLESDLFVFEKV